MKLDRLLDWFFGTPTSAMPSEKRLRAKLEQIITDQDMREHLMPMLVSCAHELMTGEQVAMHVQFAIGEYTVPPKPYAVWYKLQTMTESIIEVMCPTMRVREDALEHNRHATHGCLTASNPHIDGMFKKSA